MNFQEIVQSVLTDLRRPDREAQIRALAKQVIRQVHSATEFQRDLVEELVAIPNPGNLVRINLPPNFRRYSKIAPADMSGQIFQTRNPEEGFMFVSPTDIYTQAGNLMTDIAYIAGSSLTIRASAAFTHLYALYYTYPALDDDTTETWIMAEAPEMICTGIRARFHGTTNNALAQIEAQQYAQDLDLFIANHGGVK